MLEYRQTSIAEGFALRKAHNSHDIRQVRKMFSKTLKEIRQKRNWRQKDVAEITGFHIQSIHKYEINLRKPCFSFLVALVEKGKVDPRELF